MKSERMEEAEENNRRRKRRNGGEVGKRVELHRVAISTVDSVSFKKPGEKAAAKFESRRSKDPSREAG